MELGLIWLIATGLYAPAISILLVGWLRISKKVSLNLPLPRVSVLVPTRNEEANILSLLEDLHQQDYPEGFEVIVIDDHSTDSTMAALQKAVGKVRIVRLDETKGKKAALSKGIAEAEEEIIVTIDADCRVGKKWLTTLLAPFADDGIVMSFGPVTYFGQHFSDRLQALELWSLVGVGAATSWLGMPTMCNGANLAYRKSAFQAVGGFQSSVDISSGDDEFMLQAIRAKFGAEAIRFVKNDQAMVSTQASDTLDAFLNQRRRWAGKWNLHKAIGPKLLAISVFGFHLLTLLCAIGFCLGLIPGPLFFVGLVTKVVVEFLFLRTIAGSLRQPFPWLGFICWQLVYSVYAVAIGLAVQRGGFVWKDRVLRK